MEENDSVAQVIAELVGNGFFDLEMTPEGILIYQLSDRAQEISPRYYKVLRDAMTDELLEYAERGLVDVRFNDELELEWKWTATGIKYMQEQGVVFDDDEE